LNPPVVPLTAVPVQASEKAAREQYAAIIAAARRSPLGIRVRLELAEMDAQRGQNDAALELLAGAIEDNPPPELAERLHLRLATCLLSKDDVPAALTQARAVLKNPASSLAGEARCVLAEVYMQKKEWANAIEQLVPFRDKDPWRNIPGLADRALLRLGYAFAQAQKWEESRQAMEAVVQRFPQSPWVYEARYGMGWAWQNMNQFDNACNAYAEVTRGSAAEVAARAQLQIGLCRLAQKRYPEAAKELLVVSYTYDYPEITAAALCEAGQAYLEQKQPADAAKLWQGIMQNYATSKWAEVAKQRLTGIK
jgi:tetratricopeptide (TPR) repeat protein